MAASLLAAKTNGVVASAVRPRACPKVVVAPSASSSGKSATFQSAFTANTLSRAAKRANVSARRAGVSRRAAVVTKAAVGDNLGEFLVAATSDPKLRQVVASLSEAVRTIAYKVRTASCAGTACVNSFGDEQLAVDMLADKLLFESLKYSHACSFACSEEVPEPVALGGSGFSVAFDPLDGSSIVDTNFAVGTIFGIWPGDNLVGITGREQAAAGMGIYGPRTTLVLAITGYPGTHEFLLQDDGQWLHVKETTEIGKGKLFAPGNLRATFDNPAYNRLFNYYLGEKYTLRYTGGMVPDVFQILVKEKGVFTNVSSPSSKAKLRILFEVAPLGLLIENAGGASSVDGKAMSALDLPITAYDQRTEIAYGSVDEIRRFEEYMYGSSPRFSSLASMEA